MKSDDIYSPPKAWIQTVQLDDDPDLEYIVTIEDEMHDDCAVVADKAADGWYSIGRSCVQAGWLPEGDDPKNIAQPHPPFIILRSYAHGSDGFSETDAGVYRLWRGRLYQTFQYVEHSFFLQLSDPAKPIPQIESKAEITFYFPFSTNIRVTNEEAVTGLDRDTRQPVDSPVTEKSCNGYEWIPATFSFERTDKATQTLCK